MVPARQRVTRKVQGQTRRPVKPGQEASCTAKMHFPISSSTLLMLKNIVDPYGYADVNNVHSSEITGGSQSSSSITIFLDNRDGSGVCGQPV